MLPIVDATQNFPPTTEALKEPNGLLAVSIEFTPELIIKAYQHGIFPWTSEDQPILWWSPDPRLVLFPDKVRITKSMAKLLKSKKYKLTVDCDFVNVMRNCRRSDGPSAEIWITHEFITMYSQLHEQGYAHSIEVWEDDELVGGLYGIALGQVFFGESMFSKVTNCSKLALIHLCNLLSEWQYKIIDCQVYTQHLVNMGATSIPRSEFEQYLHDYIPATPLGNAW